MAFKKKSESAQKESFEECVLGSILHIYIEYLSLMSQNMTATGNFITEALSKFAKASSDAKAYFLVSRLRLPITSKNREMKQCLSTEQLESWGVSRSDSLKTCISDIFNFQKSKLDQEALFCKTVGSSIMTYSFADASALQKEHLDHLNSLKQLMASTAITIPESPKVLESDHSSGSSGRASFSRRLSILGMSPGDTVRGARLSESGFDRSEGKKTTYLMIQELKNFQRVTSEESKFVFKKNSEFFSLSQEMSQESEITGSSATSILSSPRKLAQKYYSNSKFEHISSLAPIMAILTSSLIEEEFLLSLRNESSGGQPSDIFSYETSPTRTRKQTQQRQNGGSPVKSRNESPIKLRNESPSKESPIRGSPIKLLNPTIQSLPEKAQKANFFSTNIENYKSLAVPAVVAKRLLVKLQGSPSSFGIMALLEPWPCGDDKQLKNAEYVFKFELLRVAQKVCRVSSLLKKFEQIMLKISQYLMMTDESIECPLKEFSETVIPNWDQKLYGKDINFGDLLTIQVLSNFFSLLPMKAVCKSMNELGPVLSQCLKVPQESVEMALAMACPALFDHFVRIIPRDDDVFTQILEFHSLFGMPTLIPKLIVHKHYLEDQAIKLLAAPGFLCLDSLFEDMLTNYDELSKIFRIFLFALKVFFELVKEELQFPSFPEYMKHKLMLASLKMLRSHVNLEFISENLSEIQPLEIITNLRQLLQRGNEEFIAIIAVFLSDVNESGQMSPYDEFSRVILSSLLSIVKYLYIEETVLSFGVEDVVSAIEGITQIEKCLSECKSTLKVNGVVDALKPAMAKAFKNLKQELSEIMDNCVRNENWESSSEDSLHSTSILDFCSMLNESISLVLNLTSNKGIKKLLLSSFEELIEEITKNYGQMMKESLLKERKGKTRSTMAEYKALEFAKRLPKMPKDKKALDFSKIVWEYVQDSAKLKPLLVRLWNLEFLEGQIGTIVKTYYNYNSEKLMDIVSTLKNSALECIFVLSEIINIDLFEKHLLVFLYQDMTKRMLLPSKEREVQQNLAFSLFSFGKVFEDFEFKIDQMAPNSYKGAIFAGVYALLVDSYGCYLMDLFRWHHWNRQAMREFLKIECEILFERTSALTLKHDINPEEWEKFHSFMGNLFKMMELYTLNSKEMSEFVLRETSPALQSIGFAIKNLKK